MNFITVTFLCIFCFFIGINLNTDSEKIGSIKEQIDQIESDISSSKENSESIESDLSTIQSNIR